MSDKNKKGMSEIVTTLLIILLVIVAVGLIWGVVRTFVNQGTSNMATGTKCMEIDVYVTKANCTAAGSCNVTYTRSATGEDIAGIKLIFTNNLGEGNHINETEGNIIPFAISTIRNVNTSITDCSKITVAPYFEDGSGNKQYCPKGSIFTF